MRSGEASTYPAKDVDSPAEDYGCVSHSRLGNVALALNDGMFPRSQINHVQRIINGLPRLDLPTTGD